MIPTTTLLAVSLTLTLLMPTQSLSLTHVNQYDVIIIGAGISGVAAAREIHETSYSYLVLEARERVGGRLKTVQFGGISIDLGGSWLHGFKGHPNHPLKTIVEEYKVRELVVENATEVDFFYDQIEKVLIQGEIKEKGRKLCEKFFEEGHKKAMNLDLDLSWEEAGREVLLQIRNSGPLVQRITGGFINDYLIDYGSDLRTLPALSYDHDFEDYGLEGDDDFMAEDGFGNLVKQLAKGLRIEFKKEVTEIQRQKGKVVIKCSDGTVYTTKRLIASLPLGVLKAGKVKFTPPLPQQHLKAIQNLGLGVLPKIFLAFQENFWGTSKWFVMTSEEQGKFTWTASLSHKGKNVVSTFMSVDFMKKSQFKSDQEIVDAAVEMMSNIFGREQVKLIDSLVARWEDDPYALGSYPIFVIGSSKEDPQTLAQPIDNRIWLTGDHVSDNLGYTQGAWKAGLKSAKEVIESLQ